MCMRTERHVWNVDTSDRVVEETRSVCSLTIAGIYSRGNDKIIRVNAAVASHRKQLLADSQP